MLPHQGEVSRAIDGAHLNPQKTKLGASLNVAGFPNRQSDVLSDAIKLHGNFAFARQGCQTIRRHHVYYDDAYWRDVTLSPNESFWEPGGLGDARVGDKPADMWLLRAWFWTGGNY